MRFHWLLPSIKGIPVLMYHRVWPGLRDGLTVTPEQLAEQWNYLRERGYEAISLPEFLSIAKGETRADNNKVLLTFDDGYQNNLTYVYPLLREFNWQATFFIIGNTLEGHIEDEDPVNRKMNIGELKQLDPQTVQLAMHGYHHENFRETSPEDIKAAIRKCLQVFQTKDIQLYPSIAYPYGARPKENQAFDDLKNWMKENGIDSAFRIGNQVCRIPAPDLYEIRRIDIKGIDTLEDFRIKLSKGKLKPF
jgi:peptidoglycan/xylan/chitin deacetylase (PgdA/CDA1 family)